MKLSFIKQLVLCTALLALPDANSFAVNTNFFANFQGATAGSISSASVLNGGTAVGTWSFLGLPGANTGAGAISLAGSGNKAAVFASITNAAGVTGMPFLLATNYFVDSGSYPNTQIYDAGLGTRVVANFNTPGSFTGSAQTLIGFSWGAFGTANAAQAKGQFVRGLDASGNEVFKLLFTSGSAANTRVMYVRTTAQSNIILNSSSLATPDGTAVLTGSSGTTWNSVTVGTDPTEYIQVSILLTNSQVQFTFGHSQFTGSSVTSGFVSVNSAATTISKLEFSEMWNASQNSGNKGFWLDNVVVSDGPLLNPKAYQWKGNVNSTWNIASTANWVDLATSLASTYTEGTTAEPPPSSTTLRLRPT